MNEITFQFKSGETLTYGVYQLDGSVRTAAGTSLPEEGATGYYHASDANIQIGDQLVVKMGTNVVGGGEYRPSIDETTIVNTMSAILNVYDERI